MGDGHTRRVCLSCGAVGTTDRMTCDHCGSLTVPRVTRTIKRDERVGKPS